MTVEALVKQLGSLRKERRKQAVAALVEMGEPAVAALIRAARRRWWFAPSGATDALGQIGDPRSRGGRSRDCSRRENL